MVALRLRYVQFLKVLIDACQNACLRGVATGCGMGTNNAKALKLLGVSEMKPFFKFQNKRNCDSI
jgi:hypothetical protein